MQSTSDLNTQRSISTTKQPCYQDAGQRAKRIFPDYFKNISYEQPQELKMPIHRPIHRATIKIPNPIAQQPLPSHPINSGTCPTLPNTDLITGTPTHFYQPRSF